MSWLVCSFQTLVNPYVNHLGSRECLKTFFISSIVNIANSCFVMGQMLLRI